MQKKYRVGQQGTGRDGENPREAPPATFANSPTTFYTTVISDDGFAALSRVLGAEEDIRSDSR